MTSKVLASLVDSIYNNIDFRKDYDDLILSKFIADSPISYSQIQRLIESASILALNENDGKFQKIAFKIAIFLLETTKDKHEFMPFISQFILARLGDLPTIKHMILTEHVRDYFSFFEKFGNEVNMNYIQFPEIATSKIFNQVKIGGTEHNLTDFQSKVLITLQKKRNLSFSAPTSAGKSFIVHQFIAEQLKNSTTYCVVYVAPTRSLIKEVHDALKQNLLTFGVDTKDVLIFNSVSNMNTHRIISADKKILVMTQERLQQMVSNAKKINVNLLVIDEAQKVGEGDRGVIIEDAVQDLISLNPQAQKIFISPNTDPNRFKQIFNISDNVEAFKTNKTPVGQNFFDVKFLKETREAKVSIFMREFDESKSLYSKTIKQKLNFGLIAPRKAWVVTDIIQRKEPTLVYCNTRSDCRTVCNYILKYSEQKKISDKLKKDIDFIKTHVHSEYYLIDYLNHGVGYHYGKMPHFVRLVVKELYENKEIDTLCCTSTLIEGVNLPAKNIVLYSPKLGHQIIMERSSINNIVGRAGRLSKDYYGDIYCIDRKDWDIEIDPFSSDEVETVESATEKILSKKTQDIIKYLENGLIIITDENRSAKHVAISFMIKYLRGTDMNNYLISKCSTLDPNIRQQIIEHLKNISVQTKDLNYNVILKNRDIDPRFQHALYVFLKSSDSLVLPPFPEDEEHFYDDLLEIFRIISRILLNQDHDRYTYITTLANQWIRGFPYKMLLNKKISLNTPKAKEESKKFVNRMIDELDTDIETWIKFEYTRTLQCYCDIVEQILIERKSDLVFCKNLPEYLEAGAWDMRIFLLMDVGFTRTSALYLYDKLGSEVTDEFNCLAWLRDNMSDVLNWLPTSLHPEFDLILGKSIPKEN